MTSSTRRLLGAAACGVMVALLGGVLDAGGGDVSLVTCTGTEVIHYSPGLTNTPRTVTFVHNGVASCVGTPPIAAVEWSGGGSSVRSCNLLPQLPAPATVVTYNWSDGATTTAEQTLVVVERPAGTTVVTVVYRLISGRFAGGSLTAVVTYPNAQLNACNTAEGVTTLAGPVVLTFVSL